MTKFVLKPVACLRQYCMFSLSAVLLTLDACLCFILGQLGAAASDGGGYPKLWCALSDGKVVVFDAASWSLQQNCIQVGTSRLVRNFPASINICQLMNTWSHAALHSCSRRLA